MNQEGNLVADKIAGQSPLKNKGLLFFRDKFII